MCFLLYIQAWKVYFQRVYWQAFSEKARHAPTAQNHQWLTTKTNQSTEQTSKCSQFEYSSRCRSASSDVPFGFFSLVFSASAPLGHCPSLYVFFSSLWVALCVCGHVSGVTASINSFFLYTHWGNLMVGLLPFRQKYGWVNVCVSVRDRQRENVW